MEDEFIDVESFRKVKIQVGTVIAAEKVEKSNKLLKLRISFGGFEKTILSGISQHYAPENLINKKLIVITNLKHAKMMGIESEGMVLAAQDENGVLSLLTVDKDIKDGAVVS